MLVSVEKENRRWQYVVVIVVISAAILGQTHQNKSFRLATIYFGVLQAQMEGKWNGKKR